MQFYKYRIDKTKKKLSYQFLFLLFSVANKNREIKDT